MLSKPSSVTALRIEVTAADQAVIPGAHHHIDLIGLHQPSQAGQARTLQGAGTVAFIFDNLKDFPALALTKCFQLLNLGVTAGVLAFGLLLCADPRIKHDTLAKSSVFEGCSRGYST